MVIGVLSIVYLPCDIQSTKTTPQPTYYPTDPPTKTNCSHGLSLGNLVYIHVCRYGGEVIVDVRQFLTPSQMTIKGIGLKKLQWDRLTQGIKTINRYIVFKENIENRF